MLQKAFGNSASPVFLSFLKVVARHGRLDMLRLIHLTVPRRIQPGTNRVRVLVSTAEPLDAAAEQTILQEMQKPAERTAHSG